MNRPTLIDPRPYCRRAQRRAGQAVSSPRGGFTLLEVLITAILLATLLATIWQLFQMFGALYETGYVQTEKAQLVRSLIQQVTEDLLSAVPPPNPSAVSGGRSRSGAASAPQTRPLRGGSYAERVGLVGTYNTLRLDVVSADPPAAGPLPAEDSLLAGEPSRSEVSGELATVLYLFVPPAMTALEAAGDGPGLKRREIRLNQSSEQEVQLIASQAEPSYGAFGTPRLSLDSSAAAPLPRGDAADSPMAAPAPLNLPEVVALEFRYFDGQDWTDAWDSRARRSLPSAVEVSFELEIAASRPTRSRSRTTTTGAASPAGAGPGPAEASPPAPTLDDLHERKLSYRFVVYLPQSALAGKRTMILGSADGEEEPPSLWDSETPPEQDQPAAGGEMLP